MMTKWISLTGIVLTLSALSACQSAPTSKPAVRPGAAIDTPAETPDIPAVTGDDVLLSRIGGLSRQALEDGECGLFLWAALPARELVLFQRGQQPGADMNLDGLVQTLTRTRAEGDSIYGFFPNQSFSADGLDIRLTIASEGLQPVTQGTMIRQASMRLDDTAGWTVVLPVAGLVACQ